MNDLQERFIENRVLDEIGVGDTASHTHTVTQRDIDLFTEATGDMNPAHVDPAYAAGDMFHHVIIDGIWGGGLISAVLGMQLPGPGTIYLSQELQFRAPVSIGDVITATVTVHEKRPEKGDLVLDCVCTNQDQRRVITGQAVVRAPREKLRIKAVMTPRISVGRHGGIAALVACALSGPPPLAGIVHPVNALSLRSALEVVQLGMIVPVLVGPKVAIRALAVREGLELGASAWSMRPMRQLRPPARWRWRAGSRWRC